MIIGLIVGAFFGSLIEDTVNYYMTPEDERRRRAIKYGPDKIYTLDVKFAPDELNESLITLNRYRDYYYPHFEFLCTLLEALRVLYTKREKAMQVLLEDIKRESYRITDTEVTLINKPLRDLFPSEVATKARDIVVMINRQSNDMLRAFIHKVKNDPNDPLHYELKEHSREIFNANLVIEQSLEKVLGVLRFELLGA